MLERKPNFKTFGEDSWKALTILQRFPLIANPDYIKRLSDARLRFLGLHRGLEELENLRRFLETELQEKGTEVEALVRTIEKILDQLSSLGTTPGAETGVPIVGEVSTGPAEVSPAGTGAGPLTKSAARSLLNNLISFKALAVELRVAADSINKLNSELSQLTKELASEQLRQVQLQRQVETARDTYSVLNKKWEEVKITRESKIGTVKLANAAYPPEHRIKPKRRLNAMLAGAVGLMVMVFLAFFLEYLQTAALQKAS